MKHWYNNLEIEIQLNDNDIIPEGFIKGRLPFSEEVKKKMGQSRLGQYQRKNKPNHSEEDKKKISESLKKYWSTHTHPGIGKHPWNYGLKDVQQAWNKGLTYDESHTVSKEEMVEHINNTKRQNNSFNSSKGEDTFYELLKNIYDESDIIRQYKDERYPFNCDFYIKSEDLFIEYNGTWTHGFMPYDKTNIECQKQLEIWKNKSLSSKYYKNALHTWLDLDTKKFQYAKENNLNYIAIYKNYPILEEVQRLSKEYPKRNIQVLLEQSRE